MSKSARTTSNTRKPQSLLYGLPSAFLGSALVAASWSILSLVLTPYSRWLPIFAALAIVSCLSLAGVPAGKRRALLALILFALATVYQRYLFAIGTIASEFGMRLSEAMVQTEFDTVLAVARAHTDWSAVPSYVLAAIIAVVVGFGFARRNG
jgi:hypothetical protein